MTENRPAPSKAALGSFTKAPPRAGLAHVAPMPDADAVDKRELTTMASLAAVEPTQTRRPWRTTLRTLFQALVGFAAIAPSIAAAVEEATGYDLQGVPFVVVGLASCAAVTRVMALPGVEDFLARFVTFLAAEKPIK